MAVGPGKYDDLASYVREHAEAQAVIVVIVGGNKGEGFSVQTDLQTMLNLPEMLRHMAGQIEESLRTEK